MPLGHHVPEWAELAEELAALTSDLDATNAIVTDAWGHLWCRGVVIHPAGFDSVHDLIGDVLHGAPRPLQRGGKLDRAGVARGVAWYARSFAGVYVVLAWWPEDRLAADRASDSLEHAARAAIERRLPRIQTLTVKLPPPDGPGATSGAAAKRIA